LLGKHSGEKGMRIRPVAGFAIAMKAHAGILGMKPCCGRYTILISRFGNQMFSVDPAFKAKLAEFLGFRGSLMIPQAEKLSF